MSGSLLFINTLVSSVSDGAYALVVGLWLAGVWLADLELNQLHPGMRRMSLAAVAALAACDLLRPWILAASMSGSLQLSDLLSTFPQVVFSTHQGTIWLIWSGAILAFLASILWLSRPGSLWLSRLGPRLGNVCQASCLMVIAFSKAASGHAADNGDFTWAEILQMVHILATAVWVGGVVVSGFIVIPRIFERTQTAAIYARKLSYAATIAVGVLVGSGIYTALREANDSISALWTSAWGEVLSIKLALVLAALAMGGFNRFVCLRGLENPQKLRTLARVLMAEATTLILVIVLSGLLGGLSPPETA